MANELLNKLDIVFGERVEVIALCSKVEIKQNLSSVGSYREIYHLNGKEGAFVSGVLFKNNSASAVDVDLFKGAPVLVIGTVGEYRDVLQVHIESVRLLTDVIDRNDLLLEMVDYSIVDSVNDIMFDYKSMYNLSINHLGSPLGLTEAGAGDYPKRLLKLLQMTKDQYPEIIDTYIENISLLTNYYLNTEGTLQDRFEVIGQSNIPLIQALLFSCKEYPEYEEFVKLHHLIMKPRGCVLEILDSIFNNTSTSLGPDF